MARPQRRARRFDSRRRRKVSILTKEKIDYVDYKDVTLLRRFISDRAKIRPRRVTGNNEQQQRTVALAIKNAREMALLPYENRITTQRRSPDRRSYEAEDAAENDGETSNGRTGTREPRPGRAAAGIPAPPRMPPAEPAGRPVAELASQDEAHEAASALEDSSLDKAEEESAEAEDPVEESSVEEGLSEEMSSEESPSEEERQ